VATNSYPELREMILYIIAPKLARVGVDRATFDDDTDFVVAAILDSFDYLDLILALEEKNSIAIDFEALDGDFIATVRGLINGIIAQMSPQ
jgi:acyl carrier protein